tara:strand:- start:2895 stop:3287 length:393 start_codon:yes stop_codon:yes gene_type:complete
MFQQSKNKNSIGSILGPEIEIKGDIKVEGNLIVYGKVYGSITSKGNINTAPSSFIKGNIIANSGNINGTVEGHLDIEKKLVLGSTAILTGDLKATIVTIQEGAQFDGVCKMIRNEGAESKVKNINTASNA